MRGAAVGVAVAAAVAAAVGTHRGPAAPSGNRDEGLKECYKNNKCECVLIIIAMCTSIDSMNSIEDLVLSPTPALYTSARWCYIW